MRSFWTLEQCSVWLADLLVYQFATMFQAGFLWALLMGAFVWACHIVAIAFDESPLGTRHRVWLRRTLRAWRKRQAARAVA